MVQFHKVRFICSLNSANFVKGILYYTDAKDQVSRLEELFSSLRYTFGEARKSDGMKSCCSNMVCKTDGNHFCQTALVLSTEIRMRFDFVEHDDTICLIGVTVAVQRSTIIEGSVRHNVHRRKDRRTDCFLRDPIALQQLQLSGRSAASMASHSRNHKGFRPPFPQYFTYRF